MCWSNYEKYFLFKDLNVINKTVSHITDKGLLYPTKSIEVKFLTEKKKNIIRIFFGISRPLTVMLKGLLVLDKPLKKIENVKV